MMDLITVRKVRSILFLLLSVLVVMTGCSGKSANKKKEIIIFHAGSLSVPFKKLADEYEKQNPGVKILLEPAGSLVCARKVTELKKPCDIVASADYFVIKELLIPEYAAWNIRFATNEIVIAYQEKSKYSSVINSTNWMDILLKDDVSFSRSDPNSDPCGYRTVMTFRLAGKYYKLPELAEKMTGKDTEFIRPKEVDLVALVESNAVDYMFQYKSVAIQHNLKYIELPDEINLGNPAMDEIYKTVSVNVTGKTPGSSLVINGEYINYSLTVLRNAPHSDEAVGFTSFLLGDEGIKVFRQSGQEPIIPFTTETFDLLPVNLREILENSQK